MDLKLSKEAEKATSKQSDFADAGISNSKTSGSGVDVKSGVAVVKTISKQARKDAKRERKERILGDEGKAGATLRKAAEIGHGKANVVLGNLYWERARGEGGVEDR